MATLSSLLPSSLYSNYSRLSSPSPSFSSSASLRFPRSLPLLRQWSWKPLPAPRGIVKAVAAEEEEVVVEGPPADQPVSVPVSPSDMLTMFFKAEGTMDESAIPAVAKALEGTEGVSDLMVQVTEGIASVELTKQTTVQATGVASNLIEIIQGSGFKLQNLNLSFEDEEDSIN
ncbi:uncharacterized protein [Typha angustifolia]|uniref:uncharacterized protein n=1 Tax=Typha angustifolia TaxID=59011 RepID=UPI003C2F69F2